jgi:hypothetical protein
MSISRHGITGALALIMLTALLVPALLVRSGRSLAGAARRQMDSQVLMQVDAGYGGNFRPGAWLPVRVRVSNGGPAFSGTLLVDDSGQQAVDVAPTDHAIYARSIYLPAGGEKDLTLYLPGADLTNSLTITLDGGPAGRIVERAGLTSVSDGALLVGILSQSDALHTELRGLDQVAGGVPVLTVPLSAQTLDPEPLALANLDALVIENFSTADLSSSQGDSLEQWVRMGGLLVEIGGPTAAATLNGLPSALIMAHPGRPHLLAGLPALAIPANLGTLVAAIGAPSQGQTMLDTRGVRTSATGALAGALPLVQQQALGLGAIVYAAIDPALEPLASWPGLPRFWSLLLAPARTQGATITTAQAGTAAASSSAPALGAELDGILPPSLAVFLLLLGGYVLVLVPLNFILLKWLGRVDWAWLTLPATALLMLAIIFGTGTLGHTAGIRGTIVGVLYHTTGSREATTEQYLGLFSPATGDYTLLPGSSGLLGSSLYTASGAAQSPAPAGGVDLQFNQDTGAASLLAIPTWAARNAAFSGEVAAPVTLQGRLRYLPNGHLTGTLTNLSPYTVHSTVLAVYGAALIALGDLPAHGSVHVEVSSGATGPTQQALGDAYATIATTLGSPVAGGAVAAAAVEPAAARATDQAAGSDPLPAAPGETIGERLQRLAQILFAQDSPALFGTPALFGWIAAPLVPFSVNGGPLPRSDIDLVIQTVPVSLPRGPFTIEPGTVPARLSGATQDVQPGDIGGSISLAPQSEAFFLANLPLPGQPGLHLDVTSLTLSVFSSASEGTLSSTSAALYAWQTGRWVTVDASSGQVIVHDAAPFVNAAGEVRVRLQTQDSSIGLASQSGGITLGVTGMVRP